MEVSFGSQGEPNQEALESVAISDEKHRIRSASAAAKSQAAAAANPLPAEASNGGAVTSDPNSKDQILLSRGKH